MSSQRRRVLWVWPGRNWQRASEVAEARLGDCAEVVPTGLLVWTASPPQPYSLDVEAAALWRAVDDLGWGSVDLVGFSAGATVVISAALADGTRASTLVLIEPATVGDDQYASAAGWSSAVAELRRLPVAERAGAFARLVSAPNEPPLEASTGWDDRVDLLEDALAETGFTSSDLANLSQPTLIISGGRSSSRFSDAADRVVAVMPNAEPLVVPRLTHMQVREALPEITDSMRVFWSRTAAS